MKIIYKLFLYHSFCNIKYRSVNTVKNRNYLPVRVVTVVVETSHPVYILYKDILNRYSNIITENIIAENNNVNPELR